MMIDTHNHFWYYTTEEYGWIDPDTMGVLKGDFDAKDIGVEMAKTGLTHTIGV